jgi:hypothetical protein
MQACGAMHWCVSLATGADSLLDAHLFSLPSLYPTPPPPMHIALAPQRHFSAPTYSTSPPTPPLKDWAPA